MSSLNEEESDTNESRSESRKPSSVKRLSVLSSNSGGSNGVGNESCTIKDMKVKERSCSERSDSGFSECANHSTGQCTCEKKPDTTADERNEQVTEMPKNVTVLARPINHALLKSKLERIASLQFDEEENIVVMECQSRNPAPPQLLHKTEPESESLSATSAPPDPIESSRASDQMSSTAEEVGNEQSQGSKVDLLGDSVQSELDYDIKRYHLDGGSLRSRKKSLENQVKKELTLLCPPSIKVSTRVSDLKSRFDSAPILPAVMASKRQRTPQTQIITLKINLDRESTKNGNKICFCCLICKRI